MRNEAKALAAGSPGAPGSGKLSGAWAHPESGDREPKTNGESGSSPGARAEAAEAGRWGRGRQEASRARARKKDGEARAFAGGLRCTDDGDGATSEGGATDAELPGSDGENTQEGGASEGRADERVCAGAAARDDLVAEMGRLPCDLRDERSEVWMNGPRAFDCDGWHWKPPIVGEWRNEKQQNATIRYGEKGEKSSGACL